MAPLFKKTTLSLFATILLIGSLSAQKTWSLENCIQHAEQNSLTIKQANYAVEDAQFSEKADRMSRLPSLNGNSSGGLQAGRTIDRTTNTFVNQSVWFNSFGLNASATVFNGFRIKNSIKQSEINTAAARKDAEATENTLALNIASSYLQILLAEEQLTNATRQIAQTQEQLGQTDKLIDAGVLPQNDRLDILAQLANNENTLVQAENSVEGSYLLLKQLLELDPNEEMSVEKPTVLIPDAANPDVYLLNDVYQTALSTQPQIEASNLRLQSATLNEDIAKSGLLPSLFFSAGLNTTWSSAGLDFNNPLIGESTTVLSEPSNVIIGGVTTSVQFENTIPNITFPKKTYGSQLSENFGQNIILSLNIPIYNNHSNQVNIERAKLGILNQRVQNEQIKQNLKADIQRSIADARAAKKSFDASQRANEAANAAYVNAEKRFNLGAINTFEFSTAKANLDRSEINLTTAKYQYLFNLKVVDFYLGNNLTLK